MSTVIVTHPACLNHVTPPGHPEQVARLEYILDALAPLGLETVKAPLVADDDLLRIHPQSHIDLIRDNAPEDGWVSLDGDTHMSPGTLEAALRCAGGAVRAVDMVMTGEATNAFVAMRPPGHHCEREVPMGFCFFGNIALAAKHALDHHGLDRVAIVDFDVHHGNGTQDLVEGDKRIFFASTHQMPLYPGTGHPHETGGFGNVLNCPLPNGAGSQAFRDVMIRDVLPAVEAFKPQFLLISAGFDAHLADPLAGMNLTEDDFAWATGRLCDLADTFAQGRVVSCLEGGYDLEALAASAKSHVQGLMSRVPKKELPNG